MRWVPLAITAAVAYGVWWLLVHPGSPLRKR